MAFCTTIHPPFARTPLLLRDPAHQAALPPASRDFQARVGHPTVAGADGTTPCVVVLTRSADGEIDDLSLRLAAADIPLLRMDSDRTPGEELSWDVAGETLVTESGHFRPRVVWLRYFAPSAIRADGDRRLAAYARDQWLPWAPALLASRDAHAINAAAGPDRVAQLGHAAAAGLSTPATFVTTSLAAAARALPGDGDLIVKSLGEHYVEPVPGELTGLAPKRIERSEALAEGTPEPAPVLVQPYLPSARELRIYAVAGRLFTFAVTRPSPEALWTEPTQLSAHLIETPRELAGPLGRLVARLRLDVCAFDFLDTPGGPVFLEVNAACDWLWCESLAGTHRVSAAVRALARQLFHTRKDSR